MVAIAVLAGDETGQELLVESLRFLDQDVTGADIRLVHFDLSLANRRATRNAVVHDAAAAMRFCGFGLKAATITPEKPGDVGSPNAILRSDIEGTVILRVGQRIPGVETIGGVSAPIAVVRMAVDDAYGAREWRESVAGDEIAYRTEHISRKVCRRVARYAFHYAASSGGTVFGGPKYTVSPIYEGLLKEEMDAAALDNPDVPYDPQLIDTTYALIYSRSATPLVIPSLNRDGDCLSDFVLQLFGSIAGSESLLLSLDDDSTVRTVMAEAPHGTAPALFGKNIANPMSMILACASLLRLLPDAKANRAGTIIREEVLAAVAGGDKTADLGGNHSTSEFAAVVLERTQGRLHA